MTWRKTENLKDKNPKEKELAHGKDFQKKEKNKPMQTSLFAYEHLKPLGPRQTQVLKVITAAGSKGISNRELSQYLNLPINSITGRTKELRERRDVKKIGEKVDTKTNRPVSLWGLVNP